MRKPLKSLSLKQHNTVANCFCVGGLVVFLLNYVLARESIALLLIALFLMLSGLIYGLIFMRCPYCGHSLINYGRYRKLPDYCADCGHKIDYDPMEE